MAATKDKLRLAKNDLKEILSARIREETQAAKAYTRIPEKILSHRSPKASGGGLMLTLPDMEVRQKLDVLETSQKYHNQIRKYKE